jgi:hypothetical protein
LVGIMLKCTFRPKRNISHERHINC